MRAYLFSGIVALGVASITALPAFAEVTTVRLAKQFGIGYLPLTLIEEQGLIEKHAAAAGLERPAHHARGRSVGTGPGRAGLAGVRRGGGAAGPGGRSAGACRRGGRAGGTCS